MSSAGYAAESNEMSSRYVGVPLDLEKGCRRACGVMPQMNFPGVSGMHDEYVVILLSGNVRSTVKE